jgi:hypothetical protein
MENSSDKNPLFVVTKLLALAISRKKERETRGNCDEELDLAAKQSVCVEENKTLERTCSDADYATDQGASGQKLLRT